MISFTFDGAAHEAQPEDTIASALYRAGRRIFSRSFKYHRPRGLLCCSGKCPNCLMQVDGQPNVRTCMTPVREGMTVLHQNASPSLERDYLSVAQWADFMMPVGWYYKTFQSHRLWHLAEPHIRKVAGLGEPPTDTSGEYEHAHWKTTVAVIGGGRSGMQAALDCAAAGEDVVLVDDQPELGGRSCYMGGSAQDLAGQVKAHARIRVLTGCYCFGLYEGNLLGVVQPRPHGEVRERLIHLRASRVVVATGAYETPLLFGNNDLPGVMLSSAALRLLRIHGIKPGNRAVVAGRHTAEVAKALRDGGVEVAAEIAPYELRNATGSKQVDGAATISNQIDCDLIVVCGPRVPDAGLLAQAGAKLVWNGAAFVARDLPAHVSAVGSVLGTGLEAESSDCGRAPDKRVFACVCNDVTTSDIADAIEEGFDHIETLKRYTTTTMGPCQGRMCQRGAIELCAAATGRSIGDTGVTTSRPPNPSVTLGVLAGARHHPVRRTPIHYDHEESGAFWMDMGDWKRPRYYGAPGRETESVRAEYAAVRNGVGVIDVSTLGKLDVKGRDAGKLLDKVYTHRFSDLKEGRVRYAVICDDAGVMLDDGTITRLGENHYFITTTTGNLEFVDQWLRWWLVGTGWDVHIANVTASLAAVNVAGPNARRLLEPVVEGGLGAFPYMAARQTKVAGIAATMMRIGFVGETGWEIHCPAEEGSDLWRALVEAGARPFGVEAQRLLRLEKKHVIIGVDSDALTTPFQADLAWVAKLDKPDFVGRQALTAASKMEPADKLVGFLMKDDALPEDGCPVVANGRPVGRVTSARYSPLRERAIGLAWVPAAQAHDGAEIAIRVGGRLVRAAVQEAAFYDPEGAKLKA